MSSLLQKGSMLRSLFCNYLSTMGVAGWASHLPFLMKCLSVSLAAFKSQSKPRLNEWYINRVKITSLIRVQNLTKLLSHDV